MEPNGRSLARKLVSVVGAILLVVFAVHAAGKNYRYNSAKQHAHLAEMRSALAQFKADCGGYPSALTDLAIAIGRDAKGGDDKPLRSNNWRGPYLPHGVPIDPITLRADWHYTPKTGNVHSAIDYNR